MHFLSIFQSSELYRFGFGRRFLGLYLNMTDNLVAIMILNVSNLQNDLQKSFLKPTSPLV